MRKARQHPIAVIAICFALGIVLQNFLHLRFWSLFWAAVLALSGCRIVINKRYVVNILIAIIIILSGAMYSISYKKFPSNHIYYSWRQYRGQEVVLKGIVVSDIEVKHRKSLRQKFVVQAQELQAKGRKISVDGKVLIHCYKNIRLRYGDIIQFKGKIYRPYDFSDDKKFSYKKYLNRRGIYLMSNIKKASKVIVYGNKGNPLKGYVYDLRNRLKMTLNKFLSKNEAGIISALVLGDRSQLPKKVREIFVRTGTAHILAISGMHIGIMATIFYLIIRTLPIPLPLQYFLNILLLVFYCFFTGARASVIRATIMAVAFLFSLLLERDTDGINSLSLAAMILLLMNPMYILDVGFQLSFASVLVIIVLFPALYYGKIKEILQGCPKFLDGMVQLFLVSLCAWLGVLGLIAYYFEIVTPVSLLANLFIVPALGLIVFIAVGLLGFGVLLPGLAPSFAILLKISLNSLVGLIYWMEKMPAAYLFIRDVSIWSIITYYIVLSILMVILLISLKISASESWPYPMSRK